jgi:hypothetical protein
VIHAFLILVLGVGDQLHAVVTFTFVKQPKVVPCVSNVLCVRRIIVLYLCFILFCVMGILCLCFVCPEFEEHYVLMLDALLYVDDLMPRLGFP